MKNVKIMLMSALVVAAVGGAFAFKASKFTTGLKCGSSLTSCPTTSNLYSITTGTHYSGTFCTTSGGNTSVCTYVTDQP